MLLKEIPFSRVTAVGTINIFLFFVTIFLEDFADDDCHHEAPNYTEKRKWLDQETRGDKRSEVLFALYYKNVCLI